MAQQIAPGVWRFEGPGGVALEGRGADEAAAKLNAVNTYNQQASQAASTSGRTAPKAPDIVGRVKQWMVGETSPAQAGAAMQGDIRNPGTTGTALQTAGQALLPGSIEEVVMQLASGGAGRLAGAASRGMGTAGKVATRAATEVGLPAAAGAAATGVSGGDAGNAALTGAVSGSVSGLLGGAGSAVGAWLKRSRGLNDVGQQRSIRNILGPELVSAVVDDIPSLRGTVKRLPDVQLLRTEEGGRKVLGGMFDSVEGRIAATAGPVTLPAAVLAAAGRSNLVKRAPAPESMKVAQSIAQQLGVPVDDPKVVRALEANGLPTVLGDSAEVPVKTAIEIAKQFRSQGLKKGEALPGRTPRQFAEETQDAINGVTPTALQQEYTGLREDYSKFMRFRDLLESGGEELFPRMREGGGTIDLVKFHKWLMDNLGEVPPQEFPAVHRFFTGGDELGTGPTTKAGRYIGVHIPGTPIHTGVKGKEKLQLPPGQQEKITPTSRVPGVVSGVGRAVGVGSVPSVREEMR